MIQYPEGFPVAARAAVERAIAEAELFVVELQSQTVDAVVCFVLMIFEVFVREVTEIVIHQPEQWTAERLRFETQTFLDRLTEHAFTEKSPTSLSPSGTSLRTQKVSILPGDMNYHDARAPWMQGASDVTLTAFKAAVRGQLVTWKGWVNLQQKILALAEQERQAARVPTSIVGSNPPHGQLAKRAGYVRHELERLALSHTRLRTIGGPDRKTTAKILAAEPVSENVLQRLASALSVKRTDIP